MYTLHGRNRDCVERRKIKSLISLEKRYFIHLRVYLHKISSPFLGIPSMNFLKAYASQGTTSAAVKIQTVYIRSTDLLAPYWNMQLLIRGSRCVLRALQLHFNQLFLVKNSNLGVLEWNKTAWGLTCLPVAVWWQGEVQMKWVLDLKSFTL